KSGIKDIASRDRFEKQALKITGTSFYLLAAGLLINSVYLLFCFLGFFRLSIKTCWETFIYITKLPL
ncbi:MAG: hypothetical protein JW787_03080, partial [Sedimentisphaerales bacterium]|nr:hypothetical protein [Sedimentisphaerales bacterium]